MVKFYRATVVLVATLILGYQSSTSVEAGQIRGRVASRNLAQKQQRERRVQNNMNKNNDEDTEDVNPSYSATATATPTTTNNGGGTTASNGVLVTVVHNGNTLSEVYDANNGGNGNDNNQGDSNQGGGTDNDIANNEQGNQDDMNQGGGSPAVSPNGLCGESEYVDVIIVGAGMAGVAAAATLQAQDPSLTYRILESTDRVGGRVRSHSFAGYTVEDGANWIVNFNENPLLQMANNYQFQAPINDYTDYKTYGEDGIPMDQTFVDSEMDRFRAAWDAAEAEAENQWSPDHESFPDMGVRALLADQGWSIKPGSAGSLEYAIEWFVLDWEYAARDTSVRFFPYYLDLLTFHVNDQRGYEFIPQSYLQTNADPSKLRTNTRVTKVNYDETVVSNGKTYKTLVNTETSGGCMDYYSQRVILTVSSGVINNDLIDFNPPLQYPHSQYSPFYMTQYVKIFYQFPTKFWDDNELIRVLQDEEHRGHCHHWANMDHPKFYPGSRIIRCEIMTEAFDQLKDPVTQDLSQETLLTLLNPLRTAYGTANVPTPVDIYYPKLNKDRDFGFGAYSNWKIGKTFTDFAHFFGGVEDVVPYCEHNGCNANDEWTMLISGAANCYDHSEFVHGAFFSGEKAANRVLQELGYDIKMESSPCDMDWQWLKK